MIRENWKLSHQLNIYNNDLNSSNIYVFYERQPAFGFFVGDFTLYTFPIVNVIFIGFEIFFGDSLKDLKRKNHFPYELL